VLFFTEIFKQTTVVWERFWT